MGRGGYRAAMAEAEIREERQQNQVEEEVVMVADEEETRQANVAREAEIVKKRQQNMAEEEVIRSADEEEETRPANMAREHINRDLLESENEMVGQVGVVEIHATLNNSGTIENILEMPITEENRGTEGQETARNNLIMTPEKIRSGNEEYKKQEKTK